MWTSIINKCYFNMSMAQVHANIFNLLTLGGTLIG